MLLVLFESCSCAAPSISLRSKGKKPGGAFPGGGFSWEEKWPRCSFWLLVSKLCALEVFRRNVDVALRDMAW